MSARPLLLTALALGVSSYITDPTITMVVLTVAAIGVFCTFAVFWTLPTAWLSGTAAAGGIALINSIGNLAGFGGPYLIGWVKEATGNTSMGLLVLSLLPLAAGLLVFLAVTTPRRSSRTAQPILNPRPMRPHGTTIQEKAITP